MQKRRKLLNLCVRPTKCHFSFPFFSSLPISITGAVGAMVQKELTFCGGLRTSSSEPATASKDSYASECYKWTSEGWQRHKSMTKPRAFAASAWVITSIPRPKKTQKRPSKEGFQKFH